MEEILLQNKKMVYRGITLFKIMLKLSLLFVLFVNFLFIVHQVVFKRHHLNPGVIFKKKVSVNHFLYPVIYSKTKFQKYELCRFENINSISEFSKHWNHKIERCSNFWKRFDLLYDVQEFNSTQVSYPESLFKKLKDTMGKEFISKLKNQVITQHSY